jgi:transmembrane sensor
MEAMEDRQMEEAFRASELIFKHLKGELTDEEQTELDNWTEQSDINRSLFSELTNPAQLNLLLNEIYQTDRKSAYRRLSRQLFPARRGILRALQRKWYYAAAAIVLVVAAVFYLNVYNKSGGYTKKEAPPSELAADIPPGGNHAVLTRSDGKKVLLDSINIGTSLNDGDITIVKMHDGQISYQDNGKQPVEVGFNSVTTPASSKYEVVLPDGSRVWLNALSKLDYPTAFTGNIRKVSLSGEGYFAVSKDKSKPFHVNVDGMDVEVTGTEFNINAYKNEAVVRSTLFEGGVKITKDEISFELKPGQQLRVDPRTKQVKVVNDPDMEAVAAWKNGVFYLNNIDVAALMRQAERWYDIDVEYPNGVPSVNLYGEIDRNINLSELMKVLNAGGIKTRLDGRTLYVMQ